MRHTWARVDPGDSALTVRVSDARSGFLREARLLGEATIHCSHVKVGPGGQPGPAVGERRQARLLCRPGAC